MEKKELREILLSNGVIDIQSMIEVLEDGEALKNLGIGDKDQEVVEDLHAELKIEKEKEIKD